MTELVTVFNQCAVNSLLLLGKEEVDAGLSEGGLLDYSVLVHMRDAFADVTDCPLVF